MRSASPIRAPRRCRASRRCGHSRRADLRRRCCRRTSGPHVACAARAGLRRHRCRGRRPAAPRRAAPARRVLVGSGDVGRQRRDGEPVGGHRRRPRPFHAGEPRQPFPPRARSADDHARAARDLRRPRALRRARSAARGAAVRRRRRGEPHALRRRAARGVEFFVYGRVALDEAAAAPRRFPARQTREASTAIARRHGLDPARIVLAQQHPEAIDAGVFHNDVIAVGHGDVCSATSAHSSTRRACWRSSRRSRLRPSTRSSCARPT